MAFSHSKFQTLIQIQQRKEDDDGFISLINPLLFFFDRWNSTFIKVIRNLHFNLNTIKKKKKLAYYSSCRSSWQEIAGVVIFSAIPSTAVKAIANSSIGETLQKRMLITKNASLQNSSYFKDIAYKAKQAR